MPVANLMNVASTASYHNFQYTSMNITNVNYIGSDLGPNKSLEMELQGAAWTGGNGTAKGYIWYDIIDI